MQRDLPQTIDTPALLIDLPLLEKNLRSMADYCRNCNLDLRPNIKTHKSPHIAAMQMEQGAIGLVCAKLGEAEVMADAGLEPLLIANQLVGEMKLQRLLQLHRRADVTVCVARSDHVRLLADAVSRSAQQLKVFIEVDVGMQRCGLADQTRVVDLARGIVQAPSLQLTGIMGYEGHAIGTKDLEQRHEKSHQAHQKLAALARCPY